MHRLLKGVYRSTSKPSVREAVTRELKALGVTPEDNLDAGFHIKDPEGMSVQIVGA